MGRTTTFVVCKTDSILKQIEHSAVLLDVSSSILLKGIYTLLNHFRAEQITEETNHLGRSFQGAVQDPLTDSAKFRTSNNSEIS